MRSTKNNGIHKLQLQSSKKYRAKSCQTINASAILYDSRNCLYHGSYNVD